MSHGYGNGSLISIDLYCEHCSSRIAATVSRDNATYENRWDCPICSTENGMKRVPSAPMVAKASFPDGYKRAGFQELKEANRLREDISGLKPEDRAKVTREIDRLEQRPPKKG
jgi:hypothetical protein